MTIDHSEGMPIAVILHMDCQRMTVFSHTRMYIAGDKQAHVYAAAMSAVKQFSIEYTVPVNDVRYTLDWIGVNIADEE
jgi:hypothetical protein